jgi:hypothetical protein
MTLDSDGAPVLVLLPAEGLPSEIGIGAAAARLRETADWTAFARALGLERTETALRDAGSMERLLEELAVSAVLYGSPKPGPLSPDDRGRFARTCLSPVARELLPEARERLRRALETWGREHAVDVDTLAPLLEDALVRVGAA